MTRAIVNRHREVDQTVRNDHVKVSIATIRRSAKTTFSGVCKNRRTKKTGNKDPDSIWCLTRHEITLQLQQQFREGDDPGPTMVDITGLCANSLRRSCRSYIDKIISYDRSRKWYKVHYEDGDVEELAFRELSVST